ncbi:P-loop containing nucleoside triphosphate hydrolase protein [Nemania sp. FL0916]|nr:P-loop containing nucleoside triphosphate hydrolase protein [Nemania sp. FL0916]
MARNSQGTLTVGMTLGRKDLYGNVDRMGMLRWTDEKPDFLSKAASSEESKKYAVVVRNKLFDNHSKPVQIDSIVIQSPLLKNVLQEAFKNYPGVTTMLSHLEFSAPFKPFVHRRRELDAAFNNERDEKTKQHLSLLKDILSSELHDIITATEDYTKHGVVTYEEIWTIFEPECLVYTTVFQSPVVSQLISSSFISHAELGPCFQLKCKGVDWDGHQFGYATTTQFIPAFEGTMPITDLKHYPLIYHTDAKLIGEKLIARGRQFEMLAGYHYKSYKGQAIEVTDKGPSVVTVNDRIIIDTQAYTKANPKLRRTLSPLDRPIPTTEGTDIPTSCLPNNTVMTYEMSLKYQRAKPVPRKESTYNYAEQGVQEATVVRHRPLQAEHFLLCTPLIKGYALREKRWLEFFVDSVSDIAFDENAFSSLVLPEGHKSLILGISQAQMREENDFDDVVAGKGRGVIILLSGGPGIGKTLTAESVAEHIRAPLYTMSAGDLGSDSNEIEAGLARVLDMVAKWKAVLLLDECDVFLEERSDQDLDRNRIVSVFLRLLEYYQGLFFLTTNRVKNMDEAFNSRIHFHLKYPDLDRQARRLVWKGFLDRQQGGHDIGEEHLEDLELLDMNGRVIKNVLQSATLVALSRKEKLGIHHIETVLKINGHPYRDGRGG